MQSIGTNIDEAKDGFDKVFEIFCVESHLGEIAAIVENSYIDIKQISLKFNMDRRQNCQQWRRKYCKG